MACNQLWSHHLERRGCSSWVGAKSARPIKGRLRRRSASDIGFLSPFFMEEEKRRTQRTDGQNNKPDICHISDTAKRMLARKGLREGGREGMWSTLQCRGRNWRKLTGNFYVQTKWYLLRYVLHEVSIDTSILNKLNSNKHNFHFGQWLNDAGKCMWVEEHYLMKHLATLHATFSLCKSTKSRASVLWLCMWRR